LRVLSDEFIAHNSAFINFIQQKSLRLVDKYLGAGALALPPLHFFRLCLFPIYAARRKRENNDAYRANIKNISRNRQNFKKPVKKIANDGLMEYCSVKRILTQPAEAQ
jgi:hypothetical protein